MSNIGRALVISAILAAPATGAWAEMPKELKGSWVLDVAATERHVTTSPQWKAEDAKYLPIFVKQMSQFVFEFEENAIVSSMRGRRQILPVVLKENSGKTYVFEGTIRDKSVTVTVSFVDDRTINIQSSATDDMDYYLWKRGQPTDKAGADDKSLAIEIMKKALETPSNEAGEGNSE
ncbi:MAG: hypothetical protein QNJ30_20690 [Kiloniellales bacterium]|nr:hypothetical protein [Kiloniellales bacterium]